MSYLGSYSHRLIYLNVHRSLSSFLVTERRRFGVPAPCACISAAAHPSERATRARSAPRSENENTTSEGICSGSNAELHGEDTTPFPLSSRAKGTPADDDGDDDGDRGLGRCGRRRRRWSATSRESSSPHCASHACLSNHSPCFSLAALVTAAAAVAAGGRVVLERWRGADGVVEAAALQWTRSTARSTSRQRRKRAAASARSVARVLGVRKRPVRRAAREVGRKVDRWEEEVRRTCSCSWNEGPWVKDDDDDDGGRSMTGMCALSDSMRVFSTGDSAAFGWR